MKRSVPHLMLREKQRGYKERLYSLYVDHYKFQCYINKFFNYNQRRGGSVVSGKHGGSLVSESDLGPEGQEFEPWLVYPCCVLTSFPPRRSRNTPSFFILQKPKINGSTDKPSWLAQLQLRSTLPYHIFLTSY